MTTTRYWIYKIAQAFGYNRKNIRMSDAASEMHLLREAEAHLGMQVWERVENIESLSVEYWNLRKLIKERSNAREKLEQFEEQLRLAHEERAALLSTTPEEDHHILEERTIKLANLEKLSAQRDTIVADAREVRSAYTGLKMKLEVLTKESGGNVTNQEEIRQVKQQLIKLKGRFEELKVDRDRVANEIEAGDAEINAIEEKLRESRKQRRDLAADTFLAIGEGNKEISTLRAETILLETKMLHLYAEIGRHISRNAHQNQDCMKAAGDLHGLVEVMRALRRSIALNHRLADTA